MNSRTLSLPFLREPGWLLSPQAGLVAATLLWSGNFVVGRAIRGEIEPLALNFWRWVIAAMALSPFVWRGLVAQWPILRAHRAYVLALGFAGLAVPHTCSYYALQTTSPVNALLILMLMPALVVVMASRFLGQPVSRLQWTGIACSLLGAASILVRWDWAVLSGLHFTRGDLWMVPAVLAASAHTLLLRRTPAGVTQGPLLLASILAALAFMAPLVLWTGVRQLSAVAAVWPASLYVGVFASAIAFFFWNRGVTRVGPGRAAPFMYLMPLYASVLAALFIGEGVQAYQLGAGALILGGLWLARERR